jgi:hypothetical protein
MCWRWVGKPVLQRVALLVGIVYITIDLDGGELISLSESVVVVRGG